MTAFKNLMNFNPVHVNQALSTKVKCSQLKNQNQNAVLYMFA